MNKIIFVTGAAGAGKSTFIKERFADKDKFYVFDMAIQSKNLFGHFDAIEDDNLIVDIYNTLSEDAMFAMLDDLDLVVEYFTDGYDDELFAVLKEAKNIGINTEVIQLTIDAGEAMDRLEVARNNTEYFPSQNYKEDSLIILSGVMETYSINRGFDVVCELTSDDESIKLFRIGREEELFFYMSNDTVSFDFEPQFEYEKSAGVNYIKEFDNFEEALKSLHQEYPIFSLSPVNINPKYKSQFRESYLTLLEDNDNKIPLDAWGQFVN